MSNLKARLDKIEATTTSGRVPHIIIMDDGTARAGGEDTTVEAWEALYGDRVEEEQKRGRIFFGIDFRPHRDNHQNEDNHE